MCGFFDSDDEDQHHNTPLSHQIIAAAASYEVIPFWTGRSSRIGNEGIREARATGRETCQT